MLAPLFTRPTPQSMLSFFEIGTAIMQGKGSGTGWDEGAETNAALSVVKPGAIVFDVGANLGWWSKALLAEMNGAVRVFMFEPQPFLQEDLAPLVEQGCTLVPKAVGSRPGVLPLYLPEPKAGNASLHPRRDTYFEHQAFTTIDVPVITLDDFASENGIDHIDLVKIDVEGHEMDVLKGAEALISARKVKAIAFEFGSANINSRTFFRDFWDFFAAHDFALKRILPGGRLAEIPRYYEDLEHFRGVSNYLATLRPRML